MIKYQSLQIPQTDHLHHVMMLSIYKYIFSLSTSHPSLFQWLFNWKKTIFPVDPRTVGSQDTLMSGSSHGVWVWLGYQGSSLAGWDELNLAIFHEKMLDKSKDSAEKIGDKFHISNFEGRVLYDGENT